MHDRYYFYEPSPLAINVWLSYFTFGKIKHTQKNASLYSLFCIPRSLLKYIIMDFNKTEIEIIYLVRSYMLHSLCRIERVCIHKLKDGVS